MELELLVVLKCVLISSLSVITIVGLIALLIAYNILFVTKKSVDEDCSFLSELAPKKSCETSELQ